ncbi:DUF6100 family protein [Oscillibacter sp.]|uniref:DUF6100 family protein n=1 Tax=Oscillibacter sp. TaxID=1945593 RepID=UPI001B617AC9|nr:DUF6100 family protein [Oscillibacter sp.]MBP3509461.1 hypothetical protein [Oscillibacter sp.]
MNDSDTYREQLLLDAVRSAENVAIQLRQYAAAVLEPAQTVPGDVFSDNSQTAAAEFAPEGWLAAPLPGLMPRRDNADRSRFLAGLLRDAIHRAFPVQDQPKFRACVLVYEHIYDISRSRRFIDHDNLELKHSQDVLEAAFLTNDTAALCSAFQCSHHGEQDGARIWILPPEQFPEWLKSHPECWNSTTETMQE